MFMTIQCRVSNILLEQRSRKYNVFRTPHHSNVHDNTVLLSPATCRSNALDNTMVMFGDGGVGKVFRDRVDGGIGGDVDGSVGDAIMLMVVSVTVQCVRL